MFDCPNCGEPLEENASFCPHCGSDPETGWNPDVDYYSIELPEDDLLEEPIDHGDDHRPVPSSLIGPVGIVLCFVLFVSVGFSIYGLWMLPAALLVMTMALICLRRYSRSGSPPTRMQ